MENVVSSKLFLKSCLTWHFDSFPIYLKHTGRKCLILGTCQKGIMNQEPFQFTILKLLPILRSLLHYGLLCVIIFVFQDINEEITISHQSAIRSPFPGKLLINAKIVFLYTVACSQVRSQKTQDGNWTNIRREKMAGH